MYAADFHGNLMCRDAYGDDDYFIVRHGRKVYCGWNVHHILPVSCGGTDEATNLICTNIVTNGEVKDKITYKLDDCLYQVNRVQNSNLHKIVKLNQ